MDILYILGTGSKHDNIELRMSLRSICKYGTGIDKVVVAGDPVDWLSEAVIKVPIPVKYKRKHHEMMNRVQYCVENGILEGEFLISSDDHFYVKPTDFNNYPYYVKSPQLTGRVVKGERFFNYHMSMLQTRLLLERYKMPIINFEQHCNTHAHARVVKEFKKLIDESYGLERGSPPTTLIMNAWMTTDYAPKELVGRHDLKIRKVQSIEELRRMIANIECFSISDSIFENNVIMDFFNEEFPDKCIYEK